MPGFTKLFSSIVDSTIWREDPCTKVVWVTMLAKADKIGYVCSSLPGLADAARVSLEECKHALALFLAPDEYSRTKDFEGRRIMEVDGGWVLLNYLKYRKTQDEDEVRIATAERVRKHRAKFAQDKGGDGVTDVTLGNTLGQGVTPVTPGNAIAEAEAEANNSTPLPTMYPECTQPPTQSVPTMNPIFNLISKDVLPSDLSSASPLPAEVPKRKKKLKTPTPSLAEILGGKGSDDWNNYWLFASCWPKAKNANARSLAEAWMEACKKDEDIKIYEAALEYQKDFLPPKHKQDDSQFMKPPLTWLKEEAWLNAINHQGGD